MTEEQAAAPAHCHNCDTLLTGSYCAHCGQADHPLDPRLHDLAHELMHEFLHLDGKILTTLKSLIFYPGRLSAEFLAGKRARYIGPVRLYLTMSVLFFLLLAHDFKPDHAANAKPAEPGASASQSDKAEHSSDVQINIDTQKIDTQKTDAQNPAANPAVQEKKKHWAQKIEKIARKAAANPEEFEHELRANCSHAMFVLVPIFALLLQLVYRNRRHHYPSYVYFSLHYHAFVFLLFSISMLAGLLKIEVLDTLMFWVVFLGAPLYLYLAMRRVFGGTRKHTLWRLLVLSCAYSLCLLVGITVAFALTIWFLYIF